MLTDENKESIQPALLTRTEIGWLQGKKEVSPSYGRKMRFMIHKKIDTLINLEIPLLRSKGFSVTIDSNGVTTGGNPKIFENNGFRMQPADLAKNETNATKTKSARAGIRTRVEGVTVPHTGPDCTILVNY